MRAGRALAACVGWLWLLTPEYGGSPFVGPHIADVLREEPAIPFEIYGHVLPFAIDRFVEILNEPGPGGLGAGAVGVHIGHEHGQILAPRAPLRRAAATWSGAFEHDPGIAQMHLRALR